MNDNDEKLRYNLKNTGLIYHFVLIGALLLIIPAIALCYLVNKDNYYIFTEKRIAEMEEIFQIDFSGVKLEKYSEGHLTKSVEIYGIDNYKKFMEEIPGCSIKAIAVDGIRQDFVRETEMKWDMEKYEIMYEYKIGSENYYIYFFEENNDIYTASIVYSEI